MEDLEPIISFARDYGSWAGAAFAVAVALRTHASTSARTVRQLAVWLDEARATIVVLQADVERLEEHRDRLAIEVERLMPFEKRASSLAEELRRLHASIGAGGGAQDRGSSLVREPVEADVVQLAPQREGKAG